MWLLQTLNTSNHESRKFSSCTSEPHKHQNARWMNVSCRYLLISKGAKSQILEMWPFIRCVSACKIVVRINSASRHHSKYSAQCSDLNVERSQAKGLAFNQGPFLLKRRKEEGTKRRRVRWGEVVFRPHFREQDVVSSCYCSAFVSVPRHSLHFILAQIHIHSVFILCWPLVPLLWDQSEHNNARQVALHTSEDDVAQCDVSIVCRYTGGCIGCIACKGCTQIVHDEVWLSAYDY